MSKLPTNPAPSVTIFGRVLPLVVGAGALLYHTYRSDSRYSPFLRVWLDWQGQWTIQAEMKVGCAAVEGHGQTLDEAQADLKARLSGAMADLTALSREL